MIVNAKPHLDGEELDAVNEVLRSGWLTTGAQVQAFEQEFAAACGQGCHAVAVSSATAGLHLALEESASRPSSVMIPTWTFTATAHAVELAGLTPMFEDVDYHTLLMKKPRKYTMGVMPVHMAGFRNPDGYDGQQIYTVEDAAHCLPYDPGPNIAVFSFYATKPIACGEGGMVVTKDANQAERLRRARYHGLEKEAWDRHQTGFIGLEAVRRGYKYNMSDISAAIGRVQLRKTREHQARRRDICERYRDDVRGAMFPVDIVDNALNSYHLFIVKVPNNRLFVEQMAQRGVACSVHYPPLHRHKYWREKYALIDEDFPNANLAARHAVSLPLHSGMTDQEVTAVITAANEVL